MSRAAAEVGFERFVGATVEATREQFSVERALRGTGAGPAGRAIDALRENADSLERRVVRPELEAYREGVLDQFAVVLDYAESDRPFEAFRDRVLELDGYLQALREDVSERRRRRVVETAVERNRRIGDRVQPIVDRPEDEFWPATTAALDRSEALELVEDVFPFTDPFQEYHGAFRFEVRIDPADVVGPLGRALPTVSVDYTDEAIRAMSRAEEDVIDRTRRSVRKRYD